MAGFTTHAEERLSAAYQDLNKLDRQIADQESVLSRMSASKAVVEDMTAVERERQKLRELSAQRGEVGRIIIFYDNHRPEGILMTWRKGWMSWLVGWRAPLTTEPRAPQTRSRSSES
jgi:uncharacterized coiled-coil protein SlyX